jgi:excisionase family DNA binding protein
MGNGCMAAGFLSVRSASKIYDIKEKTIRKWILEGRIHGHKIGKLVRLKTEDIERLKARA